MKGVKTLSKPEILKRITKSLKPMIILLSYNLLPNL